MTTGKSHPNSAARQPSRKRGKSTSSTIDDAIRTAGTIGALERVAGIPRDADSRFAFWQQFKHLPGGKGLDAGCEELKRLIRARATENPS